jgi:hypothetical protein
MAKNLARSFDDNPALPINARIQGALPWFLARIFIERSPRYQQIDSAFVKAM